MHTYFGSNGSTIIPINVAGKGVWVFPQVPDDGNERSAATVATGIEACQDNIVWLFYHQVDGLIGGTYPGDMEWTGEHIWSQPAIFNDDVTIQTLTVQLTSTLTGNVSCGGSVALAEDLTVGGDVIVVGATLLGARVTRTGNDAFEVLRNATGPNSSTTINLHQYDVLFVPDLSADRVWTLAAPTDNKVIRAVIHWAEQTGTKNLELKDGSRSLIHLNSRTKARDGSIATVTLVYRGASAGWTVESVVRGRSTLDGPSSSGSVEAWKYEVILVPPLASNAVYTLAAPPANTEPHDVTIHWPVEPNSRTLEVISAAGSHGTLSSGAPGTGFGVGTFVLGYDGGAYYLKSAYPP